MLRFGAAVVVVFGLAGMAMADPPAGDLGALQGYWKPLQIEFEGVSQMSSEQKQQVTVVIENSEYHLYFVERSGMEPKPLRLAQMNITLDPSTNPKSIVLEFAAGPLKGQKRHGIYEIAGDQLKLCYGPVEKPKPTTFTAPPKSGYFLEIWSKQPK